MTRSNGIAGVRGDTSAALVASGTGVRTKRF